MTTKEIENFLYKEAFKNGKLALARIQSLRYGKVIDGKRNYVQLVNHECDMLMMTKSDYLIEYEIKISKADILADKKKNHNHESDYIRQQYFVIPEKLKECVELIDKKFGIILVKKYKNDRFSLNTHRKPKINKNCKKLDIYDKHEFLRLANIRLMTKGE